MKSIHCYIAKEGYAARVQDTRSYDAITFVFTFVSELARLLIRALARISCLAGHSHWYLMTTTQVDRLTITYVVTNTFPKITQSFSHG
jgi:hypothetical protein